MVNRNLYLNATRTDPHILPELEVLELREYLKIENI